MANQIEFINLGPELQALMLELKNSLIPNASYSEVIFDKEEQIAPAGIVTGPIELMEVTGNMLVNWFPESINKAGIYNAEAGNPRIMDMGDCVAIKSGSTGTQIVWYDMTSTIRRNTGKWFLAFNTECDSASPVTVSFTDLIGYTVNSVTAPAIGGIDFGIIIDSSLVDIVAEYTRIKFTMESTAVDKYMRIRKPRVYRLEAEDSAITVQQALIKYKYLDGIKAVENPGLTTYGENLWSGVYEAGEILVDSTNEFLSETPNHRTTEFFRVIPGSQVSMCDDTYNLIRWQGCDSDYGNYTYLGSSQTITVPANISWLRVTYQSSGDYSPMIVFGSDKTKTYTKSLVATKTLPMVLRRINSIVDIARESVDMVDYENSVYEKVIKVDRSVWTKAFDSADFTDITEGNDCIIAKTDYYGISTVGGWFPFNYYIEQHGRPIPFSKQGAGDSIDNLGTMEIVDDQLIVYLPIGRYDTEEELRDALHGIVIYYTEDYSTSEYYPKKDFYISENGLCRCVSRWNLPGVMKFRVPTNDGARNQNIVHMLSKLGDSSDEYLGRVTLFANRWGEGNSATRPFLYIITHDDIGFGAIRENQRYKVIIDPLSPLKESSKLISVNESFEGELFIYATYEPTVDLVAEVYTYRR